MGTELIPVADVERMAIAVAKSGLFGMKTPEQALALMLISQAEGRHPALAARDYDIIQGRPSKKAEAMLRDFLAAGGKVEWHTLTDEVADATFSHAQGGSARITWNMARASGAQLFVLKDGVRLQKTRDGLQPGAWQKYPRQMLRSRCVSEGVRTVYPAATSGMYVPEEVVDFGPRPPESRVERVREVMAEAPPIEGEAVEVPVVDTSTGEVVDTIVGSTKEAVEVDAESVIRCIEVAASVDELDEAARWAKDIKDESTKTRARHAYRARKLALSSEG